ncbi:MAG: hypothetical protein MUO26_13125 [Methanotrichaceae archaeon]|nr:hypothetical protein [Methanotrichaceae archaeon]
MERSLSKIESRMLIGKGVPMGLLTLYPIAKLSILKVADNYVQSFWLSPLAIIITGPGFDEPYILPTINEKFDLEQIDIPADLRKLFKTDGNRKD